MPRTTDTRTGIIATVGLPGSGKTTFALRRCDADPDAVCRANRDALRDAHAGRRLGTGRQEQVVTAGQFAMIREAFAAGYTTVIVDDTNLRGTGRLRRLAAELGVAFHIEEFRTVPLETCLQRNRTRQDKEPVDEAVIRRMCDESVLPWLRARTRELGRTRSGATA